MCVKWDKQIRTDLKYLFEVAIQICKHEHVKKKKTLHIDSSPVDCHLFGLQLLSNGIILEILTKNYKQHLS